MTTNFYLDKREAETLAQIKIAINHQSSSSYVSTGIRIPEDAWDRKGQAIKKSYPNASRLNLSLSTKKLDVDNAIEALRRGGKLKGMTASKIRRAVLDYLSPSDDKNASQMFLARLEQCRDSKKKYGTWITYESTVRKVREFATDADSLTFDDITYDWLVRFDEFMARTSPSANARNIKLRNIRKVFNDAIDDGITTNYPFRRFKIRPEPTEDRSMTAEQLRQLFSFDCEPWQRQYLDIFKLSFILAGLNIIDIANLKSIRNGRIEGRRAKTNQPFSFKAQPEAIDIIDRYRGKDWLLDIRDRYARYADYLHRFNDGLKKVGTRYDLHTKRTVGNPLFPDISSYYARYAWINIAAELDIPNEVIDAATAHKTKGVLSVYLRYNYNRKVDEACRRVIDYVFSRDT